MLFGLGGHPAYACEYSSGKYRLEFEDIEDKLIYEKLYETIENELLPREKEIIYMRYGLFGKQAYTQNEIAKQLGISRSYVSRIERKAIENLRNKLKSEDLSYEK